MQILAEPQVTGDNFCNHCNVLTSDQMSILSCYMLLLPDKIIMPACSSTLHLVITSLSLENSTELFGRCDIYSLGTRFTENWRRKGFYLGREEGPDNLLFASSFPNLTITKPLGLI